MNANEPGGGGLGFNIPFRRRKRRPRGSSKNTNRIPLLKFMSDEAVNHFIATSAEFAGTTLFLLFAFAGTQVALLAAPVSPSVVGATSNPSQLLYISLSFGFSLAVNAWVFFRISGGLFNPAVTMGMCLVGALPYLRGVFIFFAQLFGGITAAAICSALLPGPLISGTSLGGGTSVAQGVFIEMFLTAQLVFTIFMLAAEKHKGTFIAPIGIGLSLFIAELFGVYFTGGSVNPARSFGPSVVSHTFHSYDWIYWVGPILGSLVASGFYKFIKKLEYETANPGQDQDVKSASEKRSRKSRAMEEGRVNSNTNGNIGKPKEYGAARRPYSDSPAPPHPNDQYSGIQDEPTKGGHKPSTAGTSDSTVVSPMNGDRAVVPNHPTDKNILNGNAGVEKKIGPGTESHAQKSSSNHVENGSSSSPSQERSA